LNYGRDVQPKSLITISTYAVSGMCCHCREFTGRNAKLTAFARRTFVFEASFEIKFWWKKPDLNLPVKGKVGLGPGGNFWVLLHAEKATGI
jgi:hypothetical protein